MSEIKIPIMKPLLPEYQYISPYLEQIDRNRWYSNFGPIAKGFEARLEKFFGTESGTVVSIANGAAGLTNTLRAFDLPKGTFCIMPAWTFAATAASAIAAGLVPYFLDVDEESWALEVDQVKEQLKKINGKVSCCLVVSPFGAPINRQAWDDFTIETEIKVLIDAAAGFDSVTTIDKASPGKTPIMISMHATKVLGIGEGGVVVSTDKDLINKIRQLINFGFDGTRVIKIVATNAKMSEYAAAVGMAALDLWDQKKHVWMRLKKHYIDSFRKIFGATVSSPWLDTDWASSVCNVRVPTKNADYVISELRKYGVEAKQWWIKGCHKQPAYEDFPRRELPVTDKLGATVLGLPFSIDMTREEIDYVVNALKKIIENQHNEQAKWEKS